MSYLESFSGPLVVIICCIDFKNRIFPLKKYVCDKGRAALVRAIIGFCPVAYQPLFEKFLFKQNFNTTLL